VLQGSESPGFCPGGRQPGYFAIRYFIVAARTLRRIPRALSLFAPKIPCSGLMKDLSRLPQGSQRHARPGARLAGCLVLRRFSAAYPNLTEVLKRGGRESTPNVFSDAHTTPKRATEAGTPPYRQRRTIRVGTPRDWYPLSKVKGSAPAFPPPSLHSLPNRAHYLGLKPLAGLTLTTVRLQSPSSLHMLGSWPAIQYVGAWPGLC